MITVTPEENQEKVSILRDEIILNGIPSELEGSISLINNQKDELKIKSLALVDKKNKRIKGKNSLDIHTRLKSGQELSQSISHQLPSSTPPGVYENYILVGDKQHKVKMIVQPNIEIHLHPTNFTFQGTAPRTVHTAIITLTNRGNLPFQIPRLKHGTVLDMDLFCRAFSTGFKENEDEGFLSSMDEVTRSIKTNMVDWVSVSVDEYGQTIEPGDELLLNIHFTFPENSKTNIDYNGNFRLWEEIISVSVKSHNELELD